MSYGYDPSKWHRWEFRIHWPISQCGQPPRSMPDILWQRRPSLPAQPGGKHHGYWDLQTSQSWSMTDLKKRQHTLKIPDCHSLDTRQKSRLCNCVLTYQPSSKGLSFNSTFPRPMRDRSDSIARLKRGREYPEGITGNSTSEGRGTISLVVSSTTSRFKAVALSSRRSGMPEYLSDNFGGGWKDDMIV